MRLTWKDAVATLAAAAIVAIYVAFVQGVDVWVINDVRGVSAAILLLGLAGGCAMSSIPEEFTGKAAYVGVASVLGAAALISGAWALIAANEIALAVLFWTTLALWLIATAQHAVTPRKTAALR